MIVGCCFEGDDDLRTGREQHDVYPTALHVIVCGCRDHVTFATNLLHVPWPDRWPTETRFDHRTLQRAHDTLAAAWRHRTESIQPSLPFKGVPCSAEDRMRAWLAWLQAEVDAWRRQPHIIVLVMTILAHQNDEPGYQAEEQVVTLLRERFSTVPWLAS